VSDWWTVATGDRHEQGDLLRAFPVVLVDAVDLGGSPTVQTRIETVDVIIVTQTCDLENSKISNLLLARVVPWPDFAAAQFAAGNTAVRSSAFRRSLIRGDIPPLALLHEREGRPRLDWSVVDLRELYTAERDRVDAFVAQPGNRRRLRLTSPYKEHFAQAFARFYMRVGLPHDAASFEAVGRVAVSGLR